MAPRRHVLLPDQRKPDNSILVTVDHSGPRREECSDDRNAHHGSLHRRSDRDGAGRPPFRPHAGTALPRSTSMPGLSAWTHWDRHIRDKPGSGVHRSYRSGRGHAHCVGCVLASAANAAGGHGGSGWNRAHQLAGLFLRLDWSYGSRMACGCHRQNHYGSLCSWRTRNPRNDADPALRTATVGFKISGQRVK